MPSSRRSSTASASLFEVRLAPSRAALACFICIHLASALPALLLPLPLYVAATWLAAVAISLAFGLRRERIQAVRLLPDGRWRLSFASSEVDARLIDWFAHPWLCVARFKTGRSRRAVAIPYWMVAPEVHRRLRAVLRAASVDP